MGDAILMSASQHMRIDGEEETSKSISDIANRAPSVLQERVAFEMGEARHNEGDGFTSSG